MREIVPTMHNFKQEALDNKIVIWGAGEYCMRFLNRLDLGDVNRISYIVDTNNKKWDTQLFGINICNPENLKMEVPSNTIIVIAVENGIREIYKEIAKLGDFPILSVRILINDIFSQIAEKLFDGKQYIRQVTELLEDDESKWIYNEVIRRRMLFGEDDFRDLVIRGDAEYRLPLMYRKSRLENEIIIDCGAFNGDTLKKFVETYETRLEKIYLFECMKESIQELNKTISYIGNKKYVPEMILMPYALSDHEGKMRFAKTSNPNGSFLVESRSFAQNAIYESEYEEVEVTTLDKVIPMEQKITLIKMDIEGSEYATLHGAERIIRNNKPRLAISLYHCGEDYYRIPLFLKSLVPEYKFAVRHHNKNHCDTDLYCWVEE